MPSSELPVELSAPSVRSARSEAIAKATAGSVPFSDKYLKPFWRWIKGAATPYAWEDIQSLFWPNALFFLTKQNRFRRFFCQLVTLRMFDWFMLAAILANCVTLAMSSNRPGFKETDMGQSLVLSNYVFVGIFTFEAISKIIAYGFLLAPKTYLRNGWNILDFVVLVTAYLEFTSFGSQSTAIRSARVLRPLRTITKIKELRVIVLAVIKSIPMMVDVFILTLFYLAIFGIACVELFKGTLENRCGIATFDDAYTDISGQIQNVSYVVTDNYTEDVCAGPGASDWKNVSGLPIAVDVDSTKMGYVCHWEPDPLGGELPPYGTWCTHFGNPEVYRNFNNILYSWLAIMQHIMPEDWSYIMHNTMDGVSWWTWPLHLAMMILGAFVVLNLALAVLFLYFTRGLDFEKAKSMSEAKSGLVTGAQTPAVDGTRNSVLMLQHDKSEEEGKIRLVADYDSDQEDEPKVHSNKNDGGDSDTPVVVSQKLGTMREMWETARDHCYTLAVNKWFNVTTTIVIILNAVTLALIWYEEPEAVTQSTTYANYVFTIYFVIETVVKLMGLGLKAYFADNMNTFDFVVTTAGVADMAISLAEIQSDNSSALSVLRAFRLLRIFRLARSWKSLNNIIRILYVSMEQIIYISLLLFLFLFIFGLLGMQLFGYKLGFCDLVEGSIQLCPPGLPLSECPYHWDCYIECTAEQVGTWFEVEGSPYGGLAFCEQFPRPAGLYPDASYTAPAGFPTLPPVDPNDPPSPPDSPNPPELPPPSPSPPPVPAGETPISYWAQVGKVSTMEYNYDDIYKAIFAVFCLITLEPYASTMHLTMEATTPWAALFFVVVLTIGINIILNLFLAILLANLGELSGTREEGGTALATNVGSKLGSGMNSAIMTPTEKHSSSGPQPVRESTQHLSRVLDPAAFTFTCSPRPPNPPPSACLPPEPPSTLPPPAPPSPPQEPVDANFRSSPELQHSPTRDLRKGGSGGTSMRERLLNQGLGQGERLDGGSSLGIGGAGSVRGGGLPAASTAPSTPRSPSHMHGSTHHVGGGSGEDEGGAEAVSVEQRAASAVASLSGSGPTAGSGGGSASGSGSAGAPKTASGGGSAGASGGGSGGPGAKTASGGGSGGPGAASGGGSTAASGVAESSGVGAPQASEPMQGSVFSKVDPVGELSATIMQLERLNTSSNASTQQSLLIESQPSSRMPSPSKLHQAVSADAYTPFRALDWREEDTENDSVASTSPQAAHLVPDGTPRGHKAGNRGSELHHTHDNQVFEATPKSVLTHSSSDKDLLGQSAPLRRKSTKGTSTSGSVGEQDKNKAFSALTPAFSRGPRRSSQGGEGGTRRSVEFARRRSVEFSLTGDGQDELLVQASKKSAMLSRDLQRAPPEEDEAHAEEIEFQQKACSTGTSLFLFGPDNTLRHWLYTIMRTQTFELFMLTLILASSVTLAIDSYKVQPDSALAKFIVISDYVFTASFTLEAIMKIIVLGFAFNGPTSYIYSPWNLLDLFVVVVGWLVIILQAFFPSSDAAGALRAFRALRALRPIRATRGIKGVRVVATAIAKAVPAVMDVVLVGSLFYYIFAVLAVNLLLGQMFYCADSEGEIIDPYYTQPDGNINKSWCLQNESVHTISSSQYHAKINVSVPDWTIKSTWEAEFQRFDNVIMSLWVLFQMASLEGWSVNALAAMNTMGIEEQPLRDGNQYIGIFFIIFIVFCSFFILNLVIGVSIDKFNQLKKQKGGVSVLMTEEQTQWLTIQRLMASTKPKEKYIMPTNVLRSFAFRIVFHQIFDVFMITIILLNVFFMFLVHEDMSQEWEDALMWANVAFTSVFVVEMMLKWMAIGILPYFKDGWYQFDFVVVVLSVLGVILEFTLSGDLAIISLLRVLRVLRIFKLVPKAKGLRMMLQTLYWSLPALGNVATVLLLFVYIYSVIGMNLFGAVKLQESINRHVNFQDFFTSFLTLMSIISGENWPDLQIECMIKEDCYEVIDTTTLGAPWDMTVEEGTWLDPVDDKDLIYDLPRDAKVNRCSPAPILSVLYFCSFVLVIVYLLLQLVIGILLENIELHANMESMEITHTHILAFVEKWEELDEQGTGYIEAPFLTALLLAVPPPMGVKGQNRVVMRVQNILLGADIPYRGNKLHFLETLHALTGRVAGAELPADEEYVVHNKLVSRLPKDEIEVKYTVADFYCAMQVRTSIKGFLIRRKIYETVLKAKKAIDNGLDRPSVARILRKQMSSLHDVNLDSMIAGTLKTRKLTKMGSGRMDLLPRKASQGSTDDLTKLTARKGSMLAMSQAQKASSMPSTATQQLPPAPSLNVLPRLQPGGSQNRVAPSSVPAAAVGEGVVPTVSKKNQVMPIEGPRSKEGLPSLYTSSP